MPLMLRATVLVLALSSAGCAAVSLFSHEHTHTHHHHYDAHGAEVLSRMESLEHRLGSLEVQQYPVPGPLLSPIE